MSRGTQAFKQRDLTRAIKAYVSAGIPVDRIRTAFDKFGRPVIFIAKPSESDQGTDSWDDAIAALESR
jgi:hypothetical protein